MRRVCGLKAAARNEMIETYFGAATHGGELQDLAQFLRLHFGGGHGRFGRQNRHRLGGGVGVGVLLLFDRRRTLRLAGNLQINGFPKQRPAVDD